MIFLLQKLADEQGIAVDIFKQGITPSELRASFARETSHVKVFHQQPGRPFSLPPNTLYQRPVAGRLFPCPFPVLSLPRFLAVEVFGEFISKKAIPCYHIWDAQRL